MNGFGRECRDRDLPGPYRGHQIRVAPRNRLTTSAPPGRRRLDATDRRTAKCQTRKHLILVTGGRMTRNVTASKTGATCNPDRTVQHGRP